MKKRFKRGNILIENVIFIVLTLFFLTILILFVFSKMGSAAVLEEKYAKQIALIIDSSKPDMEIVLDMSDAIKKAEDEKWGGEIVNINIQDNVVTVKLREKGDYSYSFFNDIDVNYYLDEESYIFIMGEKIENENTGE